MKNRGETFDERLETAAKAKQALMERIREKNPTSDPEFSARQEGRAAAARARAEREAGRQIAKLAERAQQIAERNGRKAERTAIEAERANEVEDRQATRLVEQKAARDARYAARKARKKK